MAEGTMGVVLGPDLDVATQLRWAVRLAEARSLDLLILQYVESREGKTVEIPLAEMPSDKTTPVAKQVREMIEASPGFRAADEENLAVADGKEAEHDVTADGEPEALSVRLKEIRCSGVRSVREQVLVQIRKNKLKFITITRVDLNTTDTDLIRERQLFLRYSPCEVIFCYGLTRDTDLSRVVVGGANGRNAEAAMRLGRDLAVASDETMTAVRVNPSIGPDAEQVGARRLDRELRKALGETRSNVKLKVVVDDQIHRGLRQAREADDHGIVILGASRHGILSSQPGRGTAAKLCKGDPRPFVAQRPIGPATRRRRPQREGQNS